MPDRRVSAARSRSRRGRVALLALAALVLTVLTVTPDAEARTGLNRSASPVAGKGDAARRGAPVSVEDTGAVANDGQDDLEAFRRAVSQAASSSRSVLVPAGEFELSGVLVLDSVVLAGVGKASVVVSTSPYACSIVLRGTAPGIRNLRRVVSAPGARTGLIGTQSIVVDGAQDFDVSDVVVFRATGAGIFVRRATGGTVSGNVVKYTGADGIHLTDGSSGVRVIDNVVSSSADDGIAVVSYLVNSAVSHDIVVMGNRIGRGKTRGLSVVGGEDITLTENVVRDTALAGIYIATEASYDTRDTQRVVVERNTVRNTPTTAASGHTSVLVYASGGTVDQIRFRQNVVDGSATQGYGVTCQKILGVATGTVGDVYLTRNSVVRARRGPTRFLTGVLHLRGNVGF